VVLAVLLVGLFFAFPNVFDQDPAMEISGTRRAEVNEQTESRVREALKTAGIEAKGIEPKTGKLLLRFQDSESQLQAKEALEEALGSNYTLALTLSTDVPGWLRAAGAQPMYLGLDLRGGIHVLIDVDMDAAVKKSMERYAGDIRGLMRQNKLRYTTVSQDSEGVSVKFKDAAVRDEALEVIGDEFRDLLVDTADQGGDFLVTARMGRQEQQEVKRFALDQNITTLRNRVNALGVSEPIIQQQGERRIVVQLPGAQDPGKQANTRSHRHSGVPSGRHRA